MKKTKESIIAKWKKVYESAYAKAMWERKKKVEQEKERNQNNLDRKIAQIDRKIMARLKKKELDCDRKCKNEIRKLEWKPEKVYKKKKKTLNLVEFAMELMQENARLRDSDREWKGFCISCDKLVSWGNHAWGHDYSRKVKNICLCTWNINLQCNWCNRTTWPRGDKIASERVNRKYNENLARKYWESIVAQLKEWYESYFKTDYDENWVIGIIKKKKSEAEDYLVKKYIPELIEENELRWKWKDFYKPWKKWRKIFEEYLNS